MSGSVRGKDTGAVPEAGSLALALVSLRLCDSAPFLFSVINSNCGNRRFE